MRLFGISLGEGNTKVGDVFTFSLPSKTTCPGASKWCLRHCYAWRYEQIRPSCKKAYADNLRLAQDTDHFAKQMIGVLPRIMTAFRIHVSGDMFSEDYVNAWVKITRAFPKTRFWGYTRSWCVSEMETALKRLRDRPNVQLFASVDPEMKLPPSGWRTAFLTCDPRAEGLFCRAQESGKATCQECGYCIRRRSGDVIFKTH